MGLIKTRVMDFIIPARLKPMKISEEEEDFRRRRFQKKKKISEED